VDPLTNVSAPKNITPAPAGSNVKLWITDPRQLGMGLAGSGLFYSTDAASWTFAPANPDGTVYADWAPGNYTIDIVEPNGNTSDYQRRSFTVRVASSGSTVDGVKANKAGVSVVAPQLAMQVSDTIAKKIAELTALANLPLSNFTPTSPCQLLDQVTPERGLATALSAGFPKVPIRLPSFGRIRALILPVSFDDLASKRVPSELFTSTANGTRDFYFAQSYGKLAFDFFVTPNWVKMPFSVKKYSSNDADGYGWIWPSDELVKDVFRLTADQITYGDYDVVYLLLPETVARKQMGSGPAHPYLFETSSGVIASVATGGWDMYYNNDRPGGNGVVGGDWKWMSHETGHLFGLYDEDYQHKSTTLGEWGIMAAAWSNAAVELGAWDRYLQGWLTDDQIACRQLSELSPSGESITLDPVVGRSAGLKSIMIPISASKILVIESRKRKGFDSPLRSGVLVYTVDMKLGQLSGGYVIKPRPGASDKKEFLDAALRAGDSITVGGVTISVVRIGENSDVVKISN
jgi:M6 family metalloprotease-like protein